MPSHLVAARAVARRARGRAGTAGSGGQGHGRLPELHVLSAPQMQLSATFKPARRCRNRSGHPGHRGRPPSLCSDGLGAPGTRRARQPQHRSRPRRTPPVAPATAVSSCSLFLVQDPVSGSARRVRETTADPRPLSPGGPSASAVRTSQLPPASAWAVGCFFVVRLRTHCASQDMGAPQPPCWL